MLSLHLVKVVYSNKRKYTMKTNNNDRKLINFLTLLFGYTDTSDVRAIQNYQASYHSSLKERGVKETVQFYKGLHHIATQVAMGRPIEPLPFRKSDNEGIPRLLSGLKPYLQNNERRSKSFALSVTCYFQTSYLPPSFDFGSITEPGREFKMGTG